MRSTSKRKLVLTSLVTLAAITLFPSADTQQPPDLNSRNSTHVSATIGRTATFKCTAKNLVGQKTVSWVRYRDVSLIAVGKFVYISDDRFRVLHEPNSDDWFLVIKSVTYKDEGIYECQVNSDPYQTFKYSLSVVGFGIQYFFGCIYVLVFWILS